MLICIILLTLVSLCFGVRNSDPHGEIRSSFDKLQLLEASSGPGANGALVGSHLVTALACCASIGKPASIFHKELCETLKLPITMTSQGVDEYISKHGVSLGDIKRPHPLLPAIPSILAFGFSLLLHVILLVLLPTHGNLDKALRWQSSKEG